MLITVNTNSCTPTIFLYKPPLRHCPHRISERPHQLGIVLPHQALTPLLKIPQSIPRRLTLGAPIRARACLDDLVMLGLARIEQVGRGRVGLATCAALVVPDDQL